MMRFELGSLRLFEFAGCDLVLAKNLRDAIRAHRNTTGHAMLIRELAEEYTEIPRAKWKVMKFCYDDSCSKKTSIKRRIEELLEAGERPPFFVASSEW
jgi:hypothetical protein